MSHLSSQPEFSKETIKKKLLEVSTYNELAKASKGKFSANTAINYFNDLVPVSKTTQETIVKFSLRLIKKAEKRRLKLVREFATL
jgi:hypothetical protein